MLSYTESIFLLGARISILKNMSATKKTLPRLFQFVDKPMQKSMEMASQIRICLSYPIGTHKCRICGALLQPFVFFSIRKREGLLVMYSLVVDSNNFLYSWLNCAFLITKLIGCRNAIYLSQCVVCNFLRVCTNWKGSWLE